jgi:hypothetical protein
MAKREYITIEMGRGATYRSGRWTAYKHGTYPRHSVLAGQPSRTFLDSFDSLDEAKAKYPTAEVWDAPGASSYQPPYLGHLPDDGDY